MKHFLKSTPFIVIAGIINIVVFLFTIGYLMVFLYDTQNVLMEYQISPYLALLIDLALLFWFSWSHSYFLRSDVKTAICRYIPAPIYWVFYSLESCISLILMYVFWRPFGPTLYEFHPHSSPIAHSVLTGLFLGSWALMGLSMKSVGSFKQAGIEQWWNYLKKTPQRNEVPYSGPFQWIRHPIYMAFVGMMAFGPVMTLDHFILVVFLVGYIYYGSLKKEKRLLKNKTYREYSNEVPPFPFFPKGPLAEQNLFGGFMRTALFLCLFLVIPHVSFAAEFSGKVQYESFEKAQKGETKLEFIVESTKVGLFSSDVPGYVKSFSYQGKKEEQALKDLQVLFKVKDMDTDHEERDEKLHTKVINHMISPTIKVIIDTLKSGDKKVTGNMEILGKVVPVEIFISLVYFDKDSVEVSGETVLSLKKLMTIGVQDPSIMVAKLSDEIRVKFKVVHSGN